MKNPPANAGSVSLIPGSEDPLEKEMATHSSVLAWEIPWTEEPGWTIVHAVAKESDTTQQLKQQHFHNQVPSGDR